MLSFGKHPIPFVDLLGFTLHQMQDGHAQLHYTPQPAHLNSFGVTHGGATMALMDVAMAVAARSLEREDLGCVTIELKTSFMQPARGALVAQAQVLHRTKSLAYCEAKILDSTGRLCSHATGTFKYMPRIQKPGTQEVVAASD